MNFSAIVKQAGRTKMKDNEMKRNGASNGPKITAGGGAVSASRLEAAQRLENAANMIREKSLSAHDALNKSTHDVEEEVKHGAEEVADLARMALDKANDAADEAADRLDATRRFILKNDLGEMTEKAKDTVANHPEVALAAVGAGGLIAGYLIGKKLS